MTHTFTDPDLIELDRIWPLGQLLEVPEHGSIVVAGAYHGRYIHYLNEMFPTAGIVGYEPQREAFHKCRERFLLNSFVVIKGDGLGTANREVYLGRVGSDGASLMEVDGPVYRVQILDSVQELQRRPDPIDLFLMNMEGSEWALIPYLLGEMMYHRIRTLAIQFHTEYVSHERSQRVISYLSEYYNNTFNCPGWTYWERKVCQ